MTEASVTSPTDQAALTEWLRALPERTVLLDKDQKAWQVGRVRGGTCLMLANSSFAYLCRDDGDMAEVGRRGPFRILWNAPWAALPGPKERGSVGATLLDARPSEGPS